MIHAHALGRAARYYPEQVALSSGGTRRTFREVYDRVAGIAAALAKHGFRVGDRLALLLPNESDYL
jgi:long-chain acyl-CoA synthetase